MLCQRPRRGLSAPFFRSSMYCTGEVVDETRESFLTLIAELEGDYRELGRIMSQNRRAWERIQPGRAPLRMSWNELRSTRICRPLSGQQQAELQAIRTRADAARIEAQRLALAIHKADPRVRAVILFGSLAEGGPRQLDFDIDLALDGGDVDRALDLTESSPFEVDVVRLDLVPEHVRARIRARGVILSGLGLTPIIGFCISCIYTLYGVGYGDTTDHQDR